MYRLGFYFLAAFGLAALLAQCDPGEKEGTLRITYRLQNPSGDPLSCQEAGVGYLHVALFSSREDAMAASSAAVACEVDADGQGVAELSLPTGLYESAIVSLQDDAEQTAALYAGRDALWEYLTVEVTSGGLTDFVPGIVGTFAGTPPECGNGRVERGEECDDGNTVSGDGCSATCQDEEAEHPSLTVDWVPTRDGTDVTCTAISATTVDITVCESGSASEVASVTAVDCVDRSFTFTQMPWGTYDITLAGVVAGTVTVADGTALGVTHDSPGPTSVEIDLVVR